MQIIVYSVVFAAGGCLPVNKGVVVVGVGVVRKSVGILLFVVWGETIYLHKNKTN